ncbi:hypothetical protein Poli38472_002113 [Pythium oligandrum]|uniref:FYVE-type domain-containing protein n=1 Tax=Pythium oligandrum TaxID=41045 RepID=A0A8K1CGY0_PYTOL|nr:hypothetical protein Poli38472_002113 [Pythium oligandrum]|eukprot:TMW63172.1 hypothetical protein Poli38472_002113 [Pythium oligandrum]
MGVTKLTRTFSATSSPSMSPSSGSLRNKLQPEWRPDAASDSCLCCGQQFSLWCRRHHCRACGELVCAECSPHTELLPEYGYDTPVRVCKQCTGVSSASATTVSSPSPSEGLSDGELGEIDDDLVIAAVEVIASHSSHKHSKLAYEYFVQSEAVSWLVDAGVVKNRSTGVALFTRIADDGYVTMKPWKGTTRTAFYILNDVACQESRRSHYNGVMRSETAKCSNCSQSYLESLAPTPGFCSIDCKTNALISAADSARIRRYM